MVQPVDQGSQAVTRPTTLKMRYFFKRMPEGRCKVEVAARSSLRTARVIRKMSPKMRKDQGLQLLKHVQLKTTLLFYHVFRQRQ